MSKPTLPQGTRDFSSETVRKRNHILSAIRKVFELHGFQPLETPAMENLETLMGKYGEEGDKLIFRILNNGLGDPKNAEKSRGAFENVIQGRNDKNLTERALRYDLTIPFARYVAMNHGELAYPFKRYQIQPVWRADRPQKGRYREFYQCDADVVGSNSLLNEVELALIYHDVFSALGLTGYELRINSRKILAALAEKCGGQQLLNPITVAIDKLDKIGTEKVKEELLTRGLDNAQLETVMTYLAIEGGNGEKLDSLRQLLGDSTSAGSGIQELAFLLQKTAAYSISLQIDLTLARGLNYYTGVIFEAKAPATVQMGSIGGGGRYDDLTGLFGLPGIPGVGISFGVDRMYDVMEELQLFPAALEVSTTVLFINDGEPQMEAALRLARALRENNVSCELYPDLVKDDKQYKYAKRKKIAYIAFVKPSSDEVTLKDIRSGESRVLGFGEFVNSFRS